MCSRDGQDKRDSAFCIGNIYILYRSFRGSVAKMRCPTALALVFGTAITALRSPHERARNAVPERPKPNHLHGRSNPRLSRQRPAHLNSKTLSINFPGEASPSPPNPILIYSEFAVEGTSVPNVHFDIGESYAGLLPNGPHGNSSLYFWFFPSSNPDASDEITVWLNGGPGCSSLLGFLQENGPISWQSGTYAPIPNPYSWTNLTNMVWIDQPAGTGFSPGAPSVKNEHDVANQFNDFFKNFVETFDLQKRKVYLTGESYAGQYIPYIAENMLNRDDLTYYNLKGVQINDPSINDAAVLSEGIHLTPLSTQISNRI